MYIFKNALRNISRSRGRTILFGSIVFIIALSACLALSIRAASETTREKALEGMEVTGTISVDRQKLMENAGATTEGENRSTMQNMMSSVSTLTLEELKTYSKAQSVKGFYYIMNSSVSGGGDLVAVESSSEMQGAEQIRGEDSGKQATSGDFSLTGYSSDEAMTAFTSGENTITSGEVFTEGQADDTCIISSELATYNSLAVGSKITVVSPNDDTKQKILTVVGIYETSSDGGMSMGRPGQDPANSIYMSYETLEGVNTSLGTTGRINGTYTFSNVDDYETFAEDVYNMGLSEDYAVSSMDVEQFEQSLVPLESLSKYATVFLIVILILGGAILVALNLFNVRERKYEIGVLAAIGMNKKKIAKQFIYELVVITFLATALGGIVGTFASVPVTNSLLSNQIKAEEEASENQMAQFGRGPGMQGGTMIRGGNPEKTISSVDSAANAIVVLELLGVGLLLTLVAGGVAVSTVMRYDPLKILTSRD